MTLPRGIWCVLSDLEPEEIRRRGAAAIAAGASALTLRRPRCGAGAAVAAWSAPELAPAWRAVHGHADWALASGAQAVIAGVRSLEVADYRRAFPQLLVGASVHDRAEAERARTDGAAFLIFGPIWATPGKEAFLAPRGPAALAEIIRLGIPVIAIGGILTPDQAAAACAAGAHGCAVLRAAAEPAQLSELVRAAAR